MSIRNLPVISMRSLFIPMGLMKVCLASLGLFCSCPAYTQPTTSDERIKGKYKRFLSSNNKFSGSNTFASSTPGFNTDKTPLLQVGTLGNTPNPNLKYGIAIAQKITEALPESGFYGLYSSQSYAATAATKFLCGGHFEATGSNSVENLEGLAGIARIDNSTGNVEMTGNLRAMYAGIGTKGNGAKRIDCTFGLWVVKQYTEGRSVITNDFGVKLDNNKTAPGTSVGTYENVSITNLYGFYYSNPASGIIQNKYAFYSEPVGDDPGSYSFYSAGGKNFFEGNIITNNALYLARLPADPPTAFRDGAIYYNTQSNKFRTYRSGAWVDNFGEGKAQVLSLNTSTTISISSDITILADASAAGAKGIVITLPEAATVYSGNTSMGSSYTLQVKKTDHTGNPVIIKTSGANTVDGKPQASISKTYGLLRIQAGPNGAWYIVN